MKLCVIAHIKRLFLVILSFSLTVRFATASRQLAKNLEHHTLNEHGLSKRYVRCLQVIRVPLLTSTVQYLHNAYTMLMVVFPCQISEVVNHMKDLIEFSHKNNLGPKGAIVVHILPNSIFSFI
jgi:hypothetical protein